MTKFKLNVKGVIIAFTAILIISSISIAALSPGERADAYYSQGYLYYIENDYTAALGEYNKALSLNPDMAKSYYWRGKTYYQLKQYEKARQDIVKARNLSPNLAGSKAMLDKVDANIENKPEVSSKPAPAPKPEIKTEVPVKPEPKKELLISMNLRAVEISHAFQLLANETGQNIVVSKDVHGKITLSLKDVTAKEAFESMLKAGNCTYIKEGNIIRIISSGDPKRTQILSDGRINRTFTINYVETEDISQSLRSLLSGDTKVITTAGLKYIMVEGLEADVEKAEDIIDNLDTPPKQVMVEARIIEVSHNATSALGVNFDITEGDSQVQSKGLAGQPTATTATGLYYSVTNSDIDALVETLQTKTGYNLLSSPKVMALNEKEAEIITGQKLGYRVKTITDTGLIESVEFLDVGTKLVFTPSIKTSGYIIMNIHPEISEGSIVNELPQKKSTETTTQLIVKDGDTIVIGGLMKDASQKVNKGVPFLSEIPFIGVPFRRTELTTEKREIIVLISPHIITSNSIKEMIPEAQRMEKKREDERYDSPFDLIM